MPRFRKSVENIFKKNLKFLQDKKFFQAKRKFNKPIGKHSQSKIGRVMNAGKHKSNTDFLERFMIAAFLITVTQLEKTGSTGKIFIPLET